MIGGVQSRILLRATFFSRRDFELRNKIIPRNIITAIPSIIKLADCSGVASLLKDKKAKGRKISRTRRNVLKINLDMVSPLRWQLGLGPSVLNSLVPASLYGLPGIGVFVGGGVFVPATGDSVPSTVGRGVFENTVEAGVFVTMGDAVGLGGTGLCVLMGVTGSGSSCVGVGVRIGNGVLEGVAVAVSVKVGMGVTVAVAVILGSACSHAGCRVGT